MDKPLPRPWQRQLAEQPPRILQPRLDAELLHTVEPCQGGVHREKTNLIKPPHLIPAITYPPPNLQVSRFLNG